MANHGNANIIVVEDENQLKKILQVKDELTGEKLILKFVWYFNLNSLLA